MQAILGQLRATVSLAHVRAVERDRLLDHLASLADSDSVTGIGNRRIFERRVIAALDEANRMGRPFCVAILDLDGFQDINDRDGRLAGDGVLRVGAQAWSGAVRPGETRK